MEPTVRTFWGSSRSSVLVEAHSLPLRPVQDTYQSIEPTLREPAEKAVEDNTCAEWGGLRGWKYTKIAKRFVFCSLKISSIVWRSFSVTWKRGAWSSQGIVRRTAMRHNILLKVSVVVCFVYIYTHTDIQTWNREIRKCNYCIYIYLYTQVMFTHLYKLQKPCVFSFIKSYKFYTLDFVSKIGLPIFWIWFVWCTIYCISCSILYYAVYSFIIQSFVIDHLLLFLIHHSLLLIVFFMSHFSFSIIIILLTIHRILYNKIFQYYELCIAHILSFFFVSHVLYIYYTHIFVYIKYVVYEILDSTFSTNIFYDTYHFWKIDLYAVNPWDFKAGGFAWQIVAACFLGRTGTNAVASWCSVCPEVKRNPRKLRFAQGGWDQSVQCFGRCSISAWFFWMSRLSFSFIIGLILGRHLRHRPADSPFTKWGHVLPFKSSKSNWTYLSTCLVMWKIEALWWTCPSV